MNEEDCSQESLSYGVRASGSIKDAPGQERPLQKKDKEEISLTPLELSPLSEHPLVSILIVNFNYCRHVARAIRSALDQSYPHLEVVVCDDGSTDGSPEVIRRECELHPTAEFILFPENRGMAAATNAAFERCRGEVICFLDSDDSFESTKVESVVKRFQTKRMSGMLVHSLSIRENDGPPILQIPFLSRFQEGWIAERVVARGGRWRNMPTSAICLRRPVADLIFPIPEESFRRAADGYIFTIAPLLTEVSAVSSPLANYFIHGGNDFASTQITAETLRTESNFIRLQIEHANTRLRTLFGNRVQLDERNHLILEERSFALGLLEDRTRTEMLPALRSLLLGLFRDDLYSRSQRGIGAVAYAVAWISPVWLRQRWLNLILGYNPVKFWIQRIRRRVGW